MSATKKPNNSAIRLFRQKLIAASALTLPLLTFASGMFVATNAVADTTLPTGGTAISGGVTIGSPVGGSLTVTQTRRRGLVNWNSFNIGTDASVHFDQQKGANSVTVNRVVGGGSDPTRILGRLTADGKVMVLDRNGVLFGPNSKVNVGGIVAAAADLADEAAFIDGSDNGRIALTNAGAGSIENQGVIKADKLVALIGKDVKNSGEIKAATIALAAGMSDATVDMDGSGLVEFAVTPQAVEALVENTGTLKADDGVVSLTTAGVDVVAKSVINMSGVTTARTVKVDGGRITLGGKVTARGGNIKVKARSEGFADEIKVTSAAEVVATNGGNISLDANGAAGGFVTIEGTVKARQGNVALNGRQNRLLGTSTVDGDKVEFTGGVVNQAATSTLIADRLTGAVQDTAAFRGTNNQVRRVGNFATGLRASSEGGFTLVNASGRNLAITGDITTDGGDVSISHNDLLRLRTDSAVLSNGGTISLDTTGDLELLAGSALDAAGGAVDLNAGSVTQDVTSRITAALLNVQTAASALLSGANDVDTVSGFTSGGTLAFHDVDGFALDGDMTTQGGSIDLTTDSTSFAHAITVNTAGRIVSNDGDISIDTNGQSGGFITVNGTVDAGAGDVAFNGRQNRLLGSSTVSGDAVNFSGGLVNQAATSSLTATSLTGQIQDNADFRGTNNDIGSLGTFATGLRGSSIGGLTLVNASDRRFDITGAVSTDGGDVSITHNNRLDVRSTGSIVTGGGDIDLTVNDNSFLYANGLLDTRSAGGNGDVTLTSGSDIQMTAASSVINAGLLTVTSGNSVNQAAAASINADQLAGTVDKTITLNGSNNTIRQLGNITTGAHPIASVPGGFTLKNASDTTVVGNVLGGGGTINIDTTGDFGLVTGSSLDAEGGNINVTQSGTFASTANTLKTKGTGTINIEQRQGGSIDQAVNAFDNSGTGLNTVEVDAGTYNGNIFISDSNVALNGAQQGVDARDNRPGAAESVIEGYVITANNVDGLTIDGFTIENQGETVTAYGGKGSINLNSANTNIALLNNIFAGQDAGGADYRSGIVTSSGGVADVLIANNRFSDLRYGVYANPAADGLVIADNVFTGNNYGVVADGVTSLDMNRNVIDATMAGVLLSGASTNVALTGNDISGATIGLSARGGDIGLVTLNSNTFTNNATGARFESGLVDLGDDTTFNTFTGGNVGIQLNPTGLVDNMKLANDTLGYTRFVGQSDYYARLDNGAYFISGTSLPVDALNVSFDGFVPASFGGVLTAGQLQAIEGKLWDLDDAAGLGQIFAGSAVVDSTDPLPLLNQEDLFIRDPGIFGAFGNGFSLTINALPGVLTGRAATPQSLAASLNALTPAAGGDDAASLANLEPAAGGDDAASLSELEPAAGETTTSKCWSDFVNNAGVTTVQYNSGGSMAETMVSEEGCSI